MSDHPGGTGQHDHKVVGGDWREVVLCGSDAQPDLAPYTSSLIRQAFSKIHFVATQKPIVVTLMVFRRELEVVVISN